MALYLFNSQPSGRLVVAQQSVQRIFGSLRGLQAVFWLRIFSALNHFPSPPKIR